MSAKPPRAVYKSEYGIYPCVCTCRQVGGSIITCFVPVFDPCIGLEPCQNNATCFSNMTDEYTCFCDENFSGTNCETGKNYENLFMSNIYRIRSCKPPGGGLADMCAQVVGGGL